jgi:hypothetical protein
MKYVYLSLKRTHKNDDWFCFWRPEGAGYTMLVDDVGIYDEPYDYNPGSEGIPSTQTIFHSTFEKYVITVQWEGREVKVVPNNAETRKIFQVDQNNLHASHKYNLGKWHEIQKSNG